MVQTPAMPAPDTLTAFRQDLLTALGFLTRLPLPAGGAAEAAGVRRALRLFPLVGALVGLIGALAFWAVRELGLDPWLSGAIAVAVTTLVTGALHEDGLADTADGLGGGRDAAHKLEIMRDSRLGAYGGLALVFSVLLRASALAALAEPGLATAALLAAHSASRGALPAVMAMLPSARAEGLGAAVGAPDRSDLLLALALAAAIPVLALGLKTGFFVLVLIVLAAALVARLARRQLGGLTGDILGAVQQACEIAALLTVAALS